MFEKYFVTCPVAVALKAAGFDEPCMALWRTFKAPTQPSSQIIYNNEDPDAWMYECRNSGLPNWQFARPLYQQVFEWFMSKGIYLHPYYAPKFEGKKAILAQWGVNIYNLDLKFLNAGGLLGAMEGEPVNINQRDAMDQAILEAIKLLPNE